MAKKTIDDRINLYLKNKAIELGASGYADWAAKNLPSIKEDAYEKKRDADRDYARSLSGYGTRGASIYTAGLKGSGYAAYLDSLKKKNYLSRNEALDGKLAADSAYSREKYAEYIGDLDEKEALLYSKTLEDLISSKVINYEEAYDIALKSGLSDRRARDAARESTVTVRSKKKAEIINSIVRDKLTKEQTQLLATAGGLTETETNELANLAERLNQLVGDETELKGYVEYLKDLNNKRKE